MDATTTEIITCAKPGCGRQTTRAESMCIDGCGQVRPTCAGPRADWFGPDFEPPY